MVDFPGMFEAGNSILEIASQLTLKRIIDRASKAHLLLLVSSTILLPENNHLIDDIKNKLSYMF